jgi:hypothetical protein
MFAENLNEFLDPQALAKSASFVPNNGSGAVTVNVNFDEAYAEQFGIAATNPAAVGKASDFSTSSSIGAAITIDLVAFTIREREPIDDGAFVRLQLSRP